MATTFNQIPIELMLDQLKEHFLIEAQKGDNYIAKAFKVEPTKLIQHDRYSLVGLGAVAAWDGGSDVADDTINARYKSRMQQSFYRKKIELTWKTRTFAPFDIAKQMVTSLTNRMYNAKQTLGIGWLNTQLAGTGTKWNASEDKYLFDTHITYSGDSCGNKGGAVLSVGSLQKGILDLESQIDEQGENMMLRARRLYVHPANQINALEVLNKGIGLRSGTADNTRNAFDEWGLELVVCPFISTPTAWYLQADQFRTHCEIAVDMETDQWYEEGTKSMFQDATLSIAFGASDWRGWYGSTGLG